MTTIQNSTFKEKKLSNLPSDWSVCLLGENAQIRGRIGWKGLKQEEYTEDGPFLIAGKHIKSGKILWDSCDHINETRFDESKEIALELDDIIFSKDGSLGNPALVDFMPGPATINSTMMLVRCSNAALSSHYLFQVLKSDFFDALVRERVSGSSIPHIFQRDMKDFQFPWPTLAEQKKIAAILTAMDDKLDVIARQIEATKTLKRGLMQTLFSRGVGTQDADGRWMPHAEFKDSELGEIPAEWAVERIDAIASINPTRTKIDDESLDVTFLGMADISEDGKLIRQHTKTYAEVSKGFTSFVDNDVLVAKITPCFENGKGALVDGLANGIGFGSTEFHVIRADSKILDVRFIHAHTRTRKFRLLGERNMVGSAGQKRVPTEFIKSFLIAVPSLGEQQKIADILDAVDAKAENLIAKHTHYQTLKRGLMQKLLTGEWRVNVDASASGS